MNKNVNNNINDHHSEVNPDDIWTAIEPRVDALNAKKKRKRRAFILFFCGLGVAIMLSGGLYQYSTMSSQDARSNKKSSTTTEVVNKETKPLTTKAKAVKSTTEKEQVELIKSSTKQSKTEDQTESKDTPTSISEAGSLPLNSKVNSVSNLNKKNQNQKAANSQLKITQKSNENNSSSSNSDVNIATHLTTAAKTMVDDLKTINNNDLSPISAKSDKNLSDLVANSLPDADALETENTQSAETRNPKPKSSTEDSRNLKFEIRSSKLESTTTIANQRASIALNKLALLDLLQLRPWPTKALGIDYMPLMVYRKNNNTPTQNRVFAMNIGMHFGASALSRKLSGSDLMSNAYKHTRDATESTLEAIHYGVEMTVKHQSGLSLTLGYQQTDINERFDSRSIIQDTNWVNDIAFLIINLRGDTVAFYGGVRVIDKKTTTYEIYNRYRLIELPILFGYSKTLNKWDLGVQVGVLANVSLTTKGLQFDDRQQLINLNEDNDLYSTRIELGYQLGLSVQRPLIGNLGFRISPTIKYYPNAMHKNQKLTSTYYLFGGQVGLYYKFQ